MKALVVDDSMTIRRIVIKALTLAGVAESVECGDGTAALTALHGGAVFDVILLDSNLPRLNGIETLRQIRASGDKTPVIIVTTEADKSRVLEAIKTGANAYLLKPFSPEQLCEKVKGLVAVTANA